MEFRNEYAFLSNMFHSPIEYQGIKYDCAEAMFQSFKVPLEKRSMFSNISGYEAKKLGRQVQLPNDWNTQRVKFMTIAVTEKFKQNEWLKKKLLDTGCKQLQEDNYWYDTFWGVYKGRGENHLGIILMDVRRKMKG